MPSKGNTVQYVGPRSCRRQTAVLHLLMEQHHNKILYRVYCTLVTKMIRKFVNIAPFQATPSRLLAPCPALFSTNFSFFCGNSKMSICQRGLVCIIWKFRDDASCCFQLPSFRFKLQYKKHNKNWHSLRPYVLLQYADIWTFSGTCSM
jgi:hypothetical protein